VLSSSKEICSFPFNPLQTGNLLELGIVKTILTISFMKINTIDHLIGNLV
jgi:hypothetical protein